MHLGPGARRAERAADMTRLAMLLPTYARLHDIPSARTIWHYTSLEDGVHSVWPAHGGYPEAYDPRQRSWYREAMAADGPVISLPLVDVSTRRVVTSVSQKVRGPGGDVVGVTGIDVSVPGIFDSIASDPRQWSEHGEEMIVGLEEDGEITVYARDGYQDGALPWDASVEAEQIVDADGALAGHLREAAEARRVGLLQHPRGGRDALWAFAPIPGSRSFLVVVVPMSAVLARAQDMEAFVSERFAWQAGVATTGFVMLALLVFIRCVPHREGREPSAGGAVAHGDGHRSRGSRKPLWPRASGRDRHALRLDQRDGAEHREAAHGAGRGVLPGAQVARQGPRGQGRLHRCALGARERQRQEAGEAHRTRRRGHRPPRKGRPILEEQQDSGQFDPALVREFIAMIREEQALRAG